MQSSQISQKHMMYSTSLGHMMYSTCAQVHELPQSHCGDNREDTLFSRLHIYIHIYIYIYIYIYEYTYILIKTEIDSWHRVLNMHEANIHAQYTYTYIYIYIYIHIYTYRNICSYYAHTHIYIYIYMYKYIHYAYIYIYIPTSIQTHNIKICETVCNLFQDFPHPDPAIMWQSVSWTMIKVR